MDSFSLFAVTLIGTLAGGALAWLGLIIFERIKYGKAGK